MSVITADLVARVEAAVRATPGVRDVYLSGSFVSNLVGAGATALGLRGEDEPRIVLTEDGVGVRVEAVLAVEDAPGSLSVLRAARAAVVAALAAQGVAATAVVLTVAYVHSREASLPAPRI